MARPPRVEMLGDDDRSRQVGGQVGDEPRQRLDPAGRGADDDELGSVVRMPPRSDSRPDIERAPSLLYPARGKALHQLGVVGHATLVADRPEPGPGQATVIGDGQFRLEGTRRIDVDRLPPGGRPRVAGHRADGRGDGVELDDLDRIELGRGRWIGEEARIVGRDPDRPVRRGGSRRARGRRRASASRTAAARGSSCRPGRRRPRTGRATRRDPSRRRRAGPSVPMRRRRSPRSGSRSPS